MSGWPPEVPQRFTSHLIRSERLVLAVRRHPAQVLEPVLSAVAALAAVYWLQTQLSRDLPVVPDLLWALWLAVLLRALWRLYEWSQDWFVVTDRRLMLNYGVLTRRVAMMPMTKVTDMSYNRTPMGQLMGYGEFVLESAGQDQALRVVSWLPDPDLLYQVICSEIFGPDEDYGRAPDLPEPPRAPPVWGGFQLGPRTSGGRQDDHADQARGDQHRTDVIHVDGDSGWDGDADGPAAGGDGAPDDDAPPRDDVPPTDDVPRRRSRLGRMDPRRLRRRRRDRWDD